MPDFWHFFIKMIIIVTLDIIQIIGSNITKL